MGGGGKRRGSIGGGGLGGMTVCVFQSMHRSRSRHQDLEKKLYLVNTKGDVIH